MNRKTRICFALSAGLLVLFILFTGAVIFIDVQPIGPLGSSVGFATINGWVRRLLGVNMLLYSITDWASLITLPIMLGFAIRGLIQLVRRKSLLRVDGSLLVLGGFYLIVFAAYLFFEFYAVNKRPVLINGVLETSYPSSTTMLMLCVMPTAMLQWNRLIKTMWVRRAVHAVCGLFTVWMVGARLLSGVHWFTDILGGLLLSAALVMLYVCANAFIDSKKGRNGALSCESCARSKRDC